MSQSREHASRTILIAGGVVYDGLGGEGVRADVLVRDGRIEAVIPVAERIERGGGRATGRRAPGPRAGAGRGGDGGARRAGRLGSEGARHGSELGNDTRHGGSGSAGTADGGGRERTGIAIDGIERLDATGMAVCPGFIDLHAHSDLILTLGAEARRVLQRGKLLQGITTELSGNCGLAPAPVTDASGPAIRSVLSWMTPEGARWRGRSFAQYLDAIEGSLPLNAALLAAHGPIRAAVLGMGAGRADAAALARIQSLVTEALEAGAFGLSTGLIYAPGMHADTDELAAAAGPVGRAGALFTSHVRGSSETLLPAVSELLEIGRRSGSKVHHSHSEAVGPAHWGKIADVLAMEEQARAAGVRITFDLFPYHAAATMMVAIYPPWALEPAAQGRRTLARGILASRGPQRMVSGGPSGEALTQSRRDGTGAPGPGSRAAGRGAPNAGAPGSGSPGSSGPGAGMAALLGRLADPVERARIRTAVETQVPEWPPWVEGGWPHNLILACGYERILVARTGGRTGGRFDGLSLRQLGQARGCHPFDAISDLMIEEAGQVGQWIFGITGDDDEALGGGGGPLPGRDLAAGGRRRSRSVAGDARRNDSSAAAARKREPMSLLIRSPHGAIATDACDYGTGLPHPAAYGTFPRILARYVRARGLLTLAEAIRRMTSLPAAIMGLADRGTMAPGSAADIVVFDPETIQDNATFQDPRRTATGVRHLLVNGVLAVRDGALTGRDGGCLLRR